MNDRPEWFAAKRYGYGSGLPCSWQGWAVIGAYTGIVVGTSFAFEDKPVIVASIVFPLTMLLLIVAARTTRGGWSWRWGKPD